MAAIDEIVILGGGPVGLLTALLLGQDPISINVFEKKTTNELISTKRSLALSLSSIEILKKVGIDAELDQNFIPIAKIHTSQKNSFGRTVISNEDNIALGYVVNYGVLSKVLLEIIKTKKNINFFHKKNISKIDTKKQVLTLIEDEKINYKFLIISDGGENILNSDFKYEENKDFEDIYGIVSVISTEYKHNNFAYERFLKTGPMALLPIDNMNHSALIWTGSKSYIEELFDLNNLEFKNEIRKEFGERLGNVLEIDEKFLFPLKQKRLKKFYEQNILVLGNAAHILHPVAGQGFNLSVRDIDAFQKLAKEKNYVLDINFLKEYSNKREIEINRVMKFTKNIVNLFGSNVFGFSRLRSFGLFQLDNASILKGIFTHKMSFGKND